MRTIADALTQAMQHHQAGRLQEAERLYRHILQLDPRQADAMHLLGVIAHQVGRHDLAVDYIRQALRFNPNLGDAYNNLATALMELGKFEESAACYRQALGFKPEDGAVHCNLGNVLAKQGKLADAIACYEEALRYMPGYAEAHHGLAAALHGLGKVEAAVGCYQRALRLRPDFAEAHNNLGQAFTELGKFDEAAASLRQAIRCRPDYAEAHNNLGIALANGGKLEEAIASYRQAIRCMPTLARAYNNLGNALTNQGKLEEAVVSYQEAVRLMPANALCHNNLGYALRELHKLDEAKASLREAIRLKADFAEAYHNLGNVLADEENDEAEDCYRQAIRHRPDYALAHNNLGIYYKSQARLDEALGCFREALRLKPDAANFHSNILFTLHYHPNVDAAALYEECRSWNERHAAPLAAQIQPHANSPEPGRRLRIGYVSPDFRMHPLALVATPLFANHDHQQFEIFAYADVSRPDDLTGWLRGHFDVWRSIVGLADAEVADMVRRDRIDILVDLTMHMGKNRLLVFARKPAPIQVTWFAYPGTTGLTAIDYRLTDPYIDPPGQFDRFYSEESIRLPDTFWCYDPLKEEPAVNELPAAKSGHVTFSSLNTFCKVNDGTLALWARVLREVPGSHFLLLAPKGQAREQVHARFEKEVIARERVEFGDRQERLEYLKLYHRIDVGLDPLPYNGHTTSLDAFWMGVPTVTLLGNTVVGRAGWSQLCNLDLKELAGQTPEEYVAIAVGLAGDLGQLQELRATLRTRLRRSALMDGKRFAVCVERVYREIWGRYTLGRQRL